MTLGGLGDDFHLFVSLFSPNDLKDYLFLVLV